MSPEFGDRVDLKWLTRDVISQMETDLGTRLEWVAASHFNTEHPHVHVALRGVGAEGRSLRLSRREVPKHRYTSLDRIIQRDADRAEGFISDVALEFAHRA